VSPGEGYDVVHGTAIVPQTAANGRAEEAVVIAVWVTDN